MRHLLAEEAQGLIYNYTQKLFKGRVENLKQVYLDPSLAQAAREAILTLSDNLDGGIDHLPIEVQKYVYEFFAQAITGFRLLAPDKPLPEVVDDSMTDNEILSGLLRNGIAPMELPFPVKGIH